MNKQEATRIAGAVNALRPDWGASGILAILSDPRLRDRAYEDMTHAFVALALDPRSAKPTRVFEDGPWWHATATTGATRRPVSQIRPLRADDCDLCSLPRHAPNERCPYRQRNATGHGVKAPPELYALLNQTRTSTTEDPA